MQEHNEHKHLTVAEIRSGCINRVGNDKAKARMCVINNEFGQGFDFLKNYEKSVTFYGSARFKEDNPYYKQIQSLAYRISKELGYAIVTGGGPGAMEAANRGAKEAGGPSLGLAIDLPMEQEVNPYVTDSIPFYFFFARKVVLSYAAEAYVFCPGGFGTLDEFFEIITLVQTKKIPQLPIILLGKAFWSKLEVFIEETLANEAETIDKSDTSLYMITDDEDVILEAIKKAPVREG